ncbi:MAG: NADH-quinone oxidoreductase subunit J [Cyanobacteria bacterium P01_H01_bin.74]
MDSTFFWFFAVTSIAGAFGLVLSRSAIYSALSLIAVFMSIAGLYLLNNADFLAMAQVVIYAVGLTILMLFAIMFTGDKPLGYEGSNRSSKIIYCIIAAFFSALVIRTISDLNFSQVSGDFTAVQSTLMAKGSTAMLGNLLFGYYALPFELASILLLVAMIGAIVIAKKSFDTPSESGQPLDTQYRVDLASAPSQEVLDAMRKERMAESEARKESLKN